MDLKRQLFDHQNQKVNIGLYHSMKPYSHILCVLSIAYIDQDFAVNVGYLFVDKEKMRRKEKKKKTNDENLNYFKF